MPPARQGRNHIWGYYMRNLARPIWLAQPANHVDVLIGNPPWLAYRYMPRPMQASFKELSDTRNLWAGAAVATQPDLSGLFVVRCIELYLRPRAVRLRDAACRPVPPPVRRVPRGRFRVNVAFGQPWDLHAVKPSFFPVPASVVFGERADTSVPLTAPTEDWSGRLPVPNASREVAAQYITRAAADAAAGAVPLSPYRRASPTAPLSFLRCWSWSKPGRPQPWAPGRAARQCAVSAAPCEKRPWKDLPRSTVSWRASSSAPSIKAKRAAVPVSRLGSRLSRGTARSCLP